jgi:hypothetical protein
MYEQKLINIKNLIFKECRFFFIRKRRGDKKRRKIKKKYEN